ncbi:hypothetical protein CSB09_00775 [Candidatus Gracilibacteria bacterium]|nr:MAG: hypothetical protein CSB09_00775 [Candidatus Gracilibacteria bacterium]
MKKFFLFVTNGARGGTCSSQSLSLLARDGSDTKMPFKAFFNFLFSKKIVLYSSPQVPIK